MENVRWMENAMPPDLFHGVWIIPWRMDKSMGVPKTTSDSRWRADMHSWPTTMQPLTVKVYISEEFLNSSLPPSKDTMPSIRRRGKLSVLHNLAKENFSILCEVLQHSSAEEITVPNL